MRLLPEGLFKTTMILFVVDSCYELLHHRKERV